MAFIAHFGFICPFRKSIILSASVSVIPTSSLLLESKLTGLLELVEA